MENMEVLAERARQGDPEAFASLYATVYKDLYKYALYMLGRREDAEDVVQETVMAAYAQITKLRCAAAFRGWIFRILAVKCRNQRKAYLQKTDPIDEQMPDPGGDFTGSAHLRAVLEGLGEEDRQIILLHALGGYSSREIGEILGMKDATVRSREHRALERLRREQRT